MQSDDAVTETPEALTPDARPRATIAPRAGTLDDYLKLTLNARVYDVARETALERARNLSARLDNAVYLKREDNQPVFSFKLRGAYNKMAHIPADALARGVITASAGNHAQGVAFSAARMNVKAVIVVPVTTPQ
ncbi:pyridoxal-phosphate dependent enzyme, partial [Burkholderia thailandensis]